MDGSRFDNSAISAVKVLVVARAAIPQR